MASSSKDKRPGAPPPEGVPESDLEWWSRNQRVTIHVLNGSRAIGPSDGMGSFKSIKEMHNNIRAVAGYLGFKTSTAFHEFMLEEDTAQFCTKFIAHREGWTEEQVPNTSARRSQKDKNAQDDSTLTAPKGDDRKKHWGFAMMDDTVTDFPYTITTLASSFEIGKNAVFNDVSVELDEIDPNVFLTKDLADSANLKNLPRKKTGKNYRQLAHLAYARSAQIALRKWATSWTPTWRDPTQGKYIFHPEAIMRCFIFLKYLMTIKAARVPIEKMRATEGKSHALYVAAIPMVFSLIGHGGDGAPAANPAEGTTATYNVPLYLRHSVPVSLDEMNKIYVRRSYALYGSEDEEEEQVEEDDEDAQPEDVQHTPRAPRRGAAMKLAQIVRKPVEEAEPKNNKRTTSRPSLEGFPHVDSNEQTGALVHIMNQGLDLNILPRHVREDIELDAPKYDTNTTAALVVLGLDPLDTKAASNVDEITRQAAGVDFGVELDVRESNTSQETIGMAEEIQRLDKQAEEDVVDFNQACKLLQIDASTMHVPLPQIKGRVDLKPHQIGGAGSLVHRYNLRRDIRAAAVADDAGTGKSRLSLTALEAIARLNESGSAPYRPTLILCPAPLLTNWLRELETFRTLLDVFAFFGDDSREADTQQVHVRMGNGDMARAFEAGGYLDPAQKRTARCVVLSSYTTWAARTLYDKLALTERKVEARENMKTLRLKLKQDERKLNDIAARLREKRKSGNRDELVEKSDDKDDETSDLVESANLLKTQVQDQKMRLKRDEELLALCSNPVRFTEAVLALMYTKPGPFGVILKKDARGEPREGEKGQSAALMEGVNFLQSRYESLLKDRFEVVLLDEAHNVKNYTSRQHISVGTLHASFHILLSATLLMNTIYDIFAYILLARPLRVESHVHTWDATGLHDTVGLADLVEAYRHLHHRVTKQLEPASKLLDPRPLSMLIDKSKIDFKDAVAVLPFIWRTFRIRRLMGQSYQAGDQTVKIGEGIPPMLVCEVKESRLHPWNMQEYRAACTELVPQVQTYGAGTTLHGQVTIDARRRLGLVSFMPVLHRLAALTNQNDRLKDLEQWHAEPKHGLDIFLDAVLDELSPTTTSYHEAHTIAALFARHSPKLKILAAILKYHCADRAERLIIFTDALVPAWITELFLMLLGFRIAAIRSNTSATERAAICDEFMSKDCDIQVIISTYRIMSQGFNLHAFCHAMVLMEPPVNASTGIQAMKRIHRLGQTHAQVVYNLIVDHTYDMCRIYHNTTKYLPTLGGDIDPILKTLAATLLERYHEEHDGVDPDNIDDFMEKTFLRIADAISSCTFGYTVSALSTPYTSAKVLLEGPDKVIADHAARQSVNIYRQVQHKVTSIKSRARKNDLIRPGQRCSTCSMLGMAPEDCGSTIATCRHCFLAHHGGDLADTHVVHCVYHCSETCSDRYKRKLKELVDKVLGAWPPDQWDDPNRTRQDLRDDEVQNLTPDERFAREALSEYEHGTIDANLFTYLLQGMHKDDASEGQHIPPSTLPLARDVEWYSTRFGAVLRLVDSHARAVATKCIGKPTGPKHRCQVGPIILDTVPGHAGFDTSKAWAPVYDDTAEKKLVSGCLECQISGEECAVTERKRYCSNHRGETTTILCRFHYTAVQQAVRAKDLSGVGQAAAAFYHEVMLGAARCPICIVGRPADTRAALPFLTPNGKRTYDALARTTSEQEIAGGSSPTGSGERRSTRQRLQPIPDNAVQTPHGSDDMEIDQPSGESSTVLGPATGDVQMTDAEDRQIAPTEPIPVAPAGRKKRAKRGSNSTNETGSTRKSKGTRGGKRASRFKSSEMVTDKDDDPDA